MSRPLGYKNNKVRSDKGKVRKQFCKYGHDTFVVGRDVTGTCVKCRKEIANKYARKVYVAHPLPLKQFCVHGHDTFLVGRDATGWCNICKELKLKELKPKIRKRIKIYQQKHKKQRNKHFQERRKLDVNFKLACDLRIRLRQALKGNKKIGSAVKDLGCTIEFLKEYLSSQFKDGMTWSNWGIYWELDHIKELWEFNLTDPKQFKEAVNYKNLQPLTIEDHKKKTAEGKRRKILKLKLK